MAWQALVAPRKGTQDGAGWCLRYAQSFFGAPARYNSAWDAWNATQHKHGTGEALPGVPVLLWFSHYGTYGSPPTYGNWGHVAIHVPGDAIYTSPGSGYGFERWATIAQIESRFNAKYVGWSEDINGLRVAQNVNTPAPSPTPPPPSRKDTDNNMILRDEHGSIYQADDWGYDSILDFGGGMAISELIYAAESLSGGAVQVNNRQRDVINSYARNRWNKKRAQIVADVKASIGVATVDSAAISKAVIAAIEKQGVKVDTGALVKDLEDALKDDFAAIPAATASQIGQKLSK